MFVLFALISTVFPFLGIPCGLIGFIWDRKHWRWYVYCVSICMANIAFSYTPKEETDLVRYLAYVESMDGFNFSEALSRYLYREGGLYVFNVLCWIFCRMKSPHLLPAFSVFVIYCIFLSITIKSSIYFKTTNKNVIFYILFGLLCLNFYSLVNNVRNVLAFSLIAFAAFRDFAEKKRNVFTICLYLAPIFIHSTAIVLLALRLVLLLPKLLKALFAIIAVFSVPILEFVYPRALGWGEGNYFAILIKRVVIKGYQYFFDTTSEWGTILSNSTTQRLNKLLYVIIVVLFAGLAFLDLYMAVKKRKSSEAIMTKSHIRLLEFSLFLALIVFLCFSTTMAVYWRFGTILIVLGAPLFYLYTRKKSALILKGALLACAVGFLLLSTRDLFRYSYVDSIIFSPVINNIIIDTIGGFLVA